MPLPQPIAVGGFSAASLGEQELSLLSPADRVLDRVGAARALSASRLSSVLMARGGTRQREELESMAEDLERAEERAARADERVAVLELEARQAHAARVEAQEEAAGRVRRAEVQAERMQAELDGFAAAAREVARGRHGALNLSPKVSRPSGSSEAAANGEAEGMLPPPPALAQAQREAQEASARSEAALARLYTLSSPDGPHRAKPGERSESPAGSVEAVVEALRASHDMSLARQEEVFAKGERSSSGPTHSPLSSLPHLDPSHVRLPA